MQREREREAEETEECEEQWLLIPLPLTCAITTSTTSSPPTLAAQNVPANRHPKARERLKTTYNHALRHSSVPAKVLENEQRALANRTKSNKYCSTGWSKPGDNQTLLLKPCLRKTPTPKQRKPRQEHNSKKESKGRKKPQRWWNHATNCSSWTKRRMREKRVE